MRDSRYCATVSWDGYVDEDGKFLMDSDGEFILYRDKLDWLIDGVSEYLEKWKERGAYLELASKETNHESQDITDLIKSEINRRQHESK